MSSDLVIGGVYEHYKRHDQYRVLHVALLQEDKAPYVVYEAQYGDKIIWLRPLAEFLGIVIVDGVEIPRFTLRAVGVKS